MMPLYSPEGVKAAGKIGLYDSLDDDVLQCYNEFALSSLLYYAMKENACSEQSSRMTAMDAASKNAGQSAGKTVQWNHGCTMLFVSHVAVHVIEFQILTLILLGCCRWDDWQLVSAVQPHATGCDY